MKPFSILSTFFILFLAFTAPALAGNFDWTTDFNMQARENPIGFRASLAARFDLNSVQARAIISKTENPADAYIILRLAEMSGKPAGSVVDEYRSNKGNGWSSLAGICGIKPGSEEFHALKTDHDLHGGNNRTDVLNTSPDRALLLMLTRTVCRVETQNRMVW